MDSAVGDPSPFADYEFVSAAAKGTPSNCVHARNQPFTANSVTGSTLSITVPASEAQACYRPHISMKLHVVIQASNARDEALTDQPPFHFDEIVGAYGLFKRIEVWFGGAKRVDMEQQRLIGWMFLKRWFTDPTSWSEFQSGVKNQLAHPCASLQGDDALANPVSQRRHFTTVEKRVIDENTDEYDYTIDLFMPLPELPPTLPLDCWGDMTVHLDFNPSPDLFRVNPTFYDASTVTGFAANHGVYGAARPEPPPLGTLNQPVPDTAAASYYEACGAVSTDCVRMIPPAASMTDTFYTAMDENAARGCAGDNPLLCTAYLVFPISNLSLNHADLTSLIGPEQLGLALPSALTAYKNCFTSQNGFDAVGQTLILSQLDSLEPNPSIGVDMLFNTCVGYPGLRRMPNWGLLTIASENADAPFSLAPTLRRIWCGASAHTYMSAYMKQESGDWTAIPATYFATARDFLRLNSLQCPSKVHWHSSVSKYAQGHRDLVSSLPKTILSHRAEFVRLHVEVGNDYEHLPTYPGEEGSAMWPTAYSAAPPGFLPVSPTGLAAYSDWLYAGNLVNTVSVNNIKALYYGTEPMLTIPVFGGGYGFKQFAELAVDGDPPIPAADSTPAANMNVSSIPIPGVQACLNHIVIERAFPWAANRTNSTKVARVYAQEVYLKYESIPVSEKASKAIRDAMDTDEGFVERQVTVDVYTQSLPPSQDVDDQVNHTMPLTYSRIHGLVIQVFANSADYQYMTVNKGLLMSKATVLADSYQLLNLGAGEIPLPDMPFYSLTPKNVSSISRVAESTTSWIYPKSFVDQPILRDNLRALSHALVKDGTHVAWAGIKTWPIPFITVPFTNDGGYIPVANMNVQISLTLKANVESSLVYPVYVSQIDYTESGSTAGGAPDGFACKPSYITEGILHNSIFGKLHNYQDSVPFYPAGQNRVLCVFALLTTEYIWKRTPGNKQSHLIIKK